MRPSNRGRIEAQKTVGVRVGVRLNSKKKETSDFTEVSLVRETGLELPGAEK